ncbi:MAG: cold shock domain-containing protein [Neisseriaceae bacterium]|nr:cold shock domain-containing protein [Neisseriaceae bacterium]
MKEIGYINALEQLKGYGFIRRERGKDLFFLYKNVSIQNIYLGLPVKFKVCKDQKGTMATEIELI